MSRKKEGPAPVPEPGPAPNQSIQDTKGLEDRYDGPLRNRSFGLRVDDEVDVQIIAGNSLISVIGRILSFKDDLELLDNSGHYHKITMDWIIDIKLIKHNRPLPELDPEMVRKTVKPKLKKSSVDHAYN